MNNGARKPDIAEPTIAYVDNLSTLLDNQLRELTIYEEVANKLKAQGVLNKTPAENHRLIIAAINDENDVWRMA